MKKIHMSKFKNNIVIIQNLINVHTYAVERTQKKAIKEKEKIVKLCFYKR